MSQKCIQIEFVEFYGGIEFSRLNLLHVLPLQPWLCGPWRKVT